MRVTVAYWLRVGAVLAVTALLLALFVAWLGVYNVAASAGHPAWLERFLELGMTRSVQHHSRNIVAPDDLHDADRVRLGAAHFAGGCIDCHGAPGTRPNPVYTHMLPPPPDLAQHASAWLPRELFWIVRHGVQVTGMPAWSGGERADEVWSMVAFLQALPTLSSAEYRALASGHMPLAPRSVQTVRELGAADLARAACDRCHDTPQAAPSSKLVPRLAGQAAGYLARSLREYQRGERRSGFMQPVAAMLSEQQIDALAAHYSAMPAAAPTATAALSAEQQAEASLLATGAHPELRLPACLSCHGANARADYPVLAGQHAPYLAQQLRLWQSGGRRGTAWGEVMAAVATRLDATQIDTLALWFAQQPVPDAAE